jgi:glycosyltransferase involved in cell wall biosynthesis
MNIMISACAADNGRSGIGHYIKETVPRLLKEAPKDSKLRIYVESGNHFLDHLANNDVAIVALPQVYSGTIGNLAWHFLILPFITLWQRPSLVVFLAANRRLSMIPFVPTLGVVHDLSQAHVPGKYDAFRTFYVLKILTRLMVTLDRAVCVSRSTARDLVHYAGVSEAKLAVVHNGAALNLFSNVADDQQLSAYGITRPYILYTARLEHPGKNHVNLLEAFALLKDRGELQLIFAGAPWNGAEKIIAKIAQLGLTDDVIVTGFVPNEDLPMLVQNAEVFVFPSLYEGFGIPLLEAMAAGTPVCASNVSSIPEVLGDAGLLFDPKDPHDLAQVVHQVLSMPGLANLLVNRGKHRASRFTWERSVASLFREMKRTIYLSDARSRTATGSTT